MCVSIVLFFLCKHRTILSVYASSYEGLRFFVYVGLLLLEQWWMIIVKWIDKSPWRRAILVTLLFVTYGSYSRQQKNGSYLGGTWELLGRNIGGTYAFLSVILRQKESDEHTTLYATRHSKKDKTCSQSIINLKKLSLLLKKLYPCRRKSFDS